MESLAGRVILLSGWRRSLLAWIAGAFTAFALPPFDFFAACFAGFTVLVWLLDGATSGHGSILRRLIPSFATGWWFGFGYFLSGLWWIGGALLVEAEAFAWAMPFAVIGLPALLATFYGLATLLASLLWSSGIMRIAALALSFGVCEWARSTVLTGFPWNAIGYTAMPTTVTMQTAYFVGLGGMNILSVFVFAMPALLGTKIHMHRGMVLAILLVATHLGIGFVRLSSNEEAGKSVSVRIVQPAIDQEEKWDASVRDRIFATLLELSARPTKDGRAPQIIIWPETALPFLFEERPEALAQIGEMLQTGQFLLTGAVRTEGFGDPSAERFYNAVLALNSDGEIIDAVDKVHLVPFGEYVPFSGLLTQLGVERIVQSIGAFSSGAPRRPIIIDDNIGILPFICYEIVFPDHLADVRFDTDVILNVTNDAWFGQTPGPYQHFRQARLRAVETGIPLIRAANGGISGAVDSYGRIVDALALQTSGVLDLSMPLSRAQVVFEKNYGTREMAIALLFCIALIASAIRRRLRAN